MKILVVDDSRAMRMIVMRNLRQAGYGDADLVEAEHGAAALETLRNDGSFDLVLSDWNMPEMSGIELLGNLRAEGNQIDFGFVTSESSPSMRQLAAESGALFLIAKPFTIEAFSSALSTAPA